MKVNIPLLDMIKQVPTYANFLKDLCTVKRGLGIEKKAFLTDECKTHLYFEFISHAILCILYPYSCKTHTISSKLGFVGLLMKYK